MSLRSSQLTTVTKNFIRVHNAWVSDNNRVNPDETYWDATNDLLEAFEHGEIPADCRDLATAVDAFSREVDVFDNQGDAASPSPHDRFWLTLEGIVKVMFDKESFRLPELETLQQLREQKVPDLQICKIYGFFNRHEQPMPWLIKQEIEKEGSVLKTPGAIDGRDWEDPRVTARRKAGELVAADTIEHIEHKEEHSGGNRSAGPESPFDLWRQNVSVSQAAKITCQPEEKVKELFELLSTVADSGESVEEAWEAEKEKFEVKSADKTADRKPRRGSRATKEPANA